MLFFGGQDLFFVFLQFRCDESFGTDQRLLPVVVFGNQVQIRFRDLDVVAKDPLKRTFSEPMPVRSRSRVSTAAR